MRRLAMSVGAGLLLACVTASGAEPKKHAASGQTPAMVSVTPNTRLCDAEAETEVVTSITVPALKELCADLGFDPKDDKDTDGDPSLLLEMGKLKVGLLLYGSLREEPTQVRSLALQMRLVMRETASVQKANSWNEASRYTRAYARDKAFLLEADLDLEGGVTWRTVSRFLIAFRTAAADFAKHVDFN